MWRPSTTCPRSFAVDRPRGIHRRFADWLQRTVAGVLFEYETRARAPGRAWLWRSIARPARRDERGDDASTGVAGSTREHERSRSRAPQPAVRGHGDDAAGLPRGVGLEPGATQGRAADPRSTGAPAWQEGRGGASTTGDTAEEEGRRRASASGVSGSVVCRRRAPSLPRAFAPHDEPARTEEQPLQLLTM